MGVSTGVLEPSSLHIRQSLLSWVLAKGPGRTRLSIQPSLTLLPCCGQAMQMSEMVLGRARFRQSVSRDWRGREEAGLGHDPVSRAECPAQGKEAQGPHLGL